MSDLESRFMRNTEMNWSSRCSTENIAQGRHTHFVAEISASSNCRKIVALQKSHFGFPFPNFDLRGGRRFYIYIVVVPPFRCLVGLDLSFHEE